MASNWYVNYVHFSFARIEKVSIDRKVRVQGDTKDIQLDYGEKFFMATPIENGIQDA